MVLRYFSILISSAALLMSYAASVAQADPTVFFPSSPIHEDDGLSAEYDLKALGCAFELMEYWPSHSAPRRITTTVFDLSDYDTNPMRVNGPYPNAPLSSRHNLVWFAADVTEAQLVGVNLKLRDARLSLRELGHLDTPSARKKRAHLRDLLKEVASGGFGDFVERNHTASYRVAAGEKVLVGVSVSRALRLPAEREAAGSLKHAMDSYRADVCPA